MKRIAISKLVLDMSVYPRMGVDEDHVFGLVEAYRCGVELPPPVVCGSSFRIVDGVHRIRALSNVGGCATEIEVLERFYRSDEELFLDAVRLNAKHGRALTTDDRRRVCGLADRLRVDLDKLATELSMSRAMVGGLRAAACADAADDDASRAQAGGMRPRKLKSRSNLRGAYPLQDLAASIKQTRSELSEVNPTVAARDSRMVQLVNALHEDVDDFVRAMKKTRPG